MTWLFFLLFLGMDISLPPEVVKPSFCDGPSGFYLLDTRGPALYALDRTGRVLAVRNKKGFGPGEFQNPVALAAFRDRVYVVELKSQRLLVFDTLLQPIQHITLPGLGRDLAVNEQGIFLVAHVPQRGTMLVKYGLDLKQEPVFFGEPLEPQDALMGIQSGNIALAQGQLYFLHTFQPMLKVYSYEGRKIKDIEIPGCSDTFPRHIDTTNINFHEKLTTRLKLGSLKQQLSVRIIDQREEKTTNLVFDPVKETWSKGTESPYQLFEVLGTTYRLEENEEHLVLKRTTQP